jgi:hypothetical protein
MGGRASKREGCVAIRAPSLYVENRNNVMQFYRKLEHRREGDLADRQPGFNRMFDLASGEKAKPYLFSH